MRRASRVIWRANVAGHEQKHGSPDERLVLGQAARPLYLAGIVAAVAGLLPGFVFGSRSFYFAYLSALAFFLSLSLGGLFFVLVHHLTRAGWGVVVRRQAEDIASLVPVLGILCVPVLISVAVQRGQLYRWALPVSSASPQTLAAAAHGEPDELAEKLDEGAPIPEKPALDSVILQKRLYGIYWLNPWFFIVRVIAYFAIWSWIAVSYRNQSILQDKTGDVELTRKMQARSGFLMVVLGLTLTGAAGDLIMSLDPHWYSTMWGVYYFAGSAIGIFSLLIIMVYLLQRAGYLRNSITVEHYHDLGKYLFGFTFFWGYIAFGQYMLLWYANIPEEIAWFSRHGATTVAQNITGWSYVMVAILFGQLLIPYALLLSRFFKRRPGILVWLAVWQLAFHLLDVYWMVMPELPGPFTATTILLSVLAFVGVGGVMLAVLVSRMAGENLRPLADPRLAESLAFENF